jgi:regulator of protease activity HflC (stomatin/prohibitin superfamily)
LITADAGLVHVQWKITYKIEDVAGYVSNIYGREIEAAEGLIKTIVENAGIHVVAGLTAEEAIRTKVDAVQGEMKRLINERLMALETGITVTRVEMYEPTPPIPVRKAFDETQVAENYKQKRIRDAEQDRTRVLNQAAGAAYTELLDLLDKVDKAEANGQPTGELLAELDRLLDSEVSGEAGKRIKDAGAYLSTVVGQMQSDVDLYRTLLPAFEHNPGLLVARLWEQTKLEIFNQPGVSKFYRPPQSQVRLHIPLDPEETRLAEERRLREREFDASQLRPQKWVPVGPEMD